MTVAGGPLEGVRVLERSASVAGQAAGMLLADLGADVVRLVPPDDVERTGLPGWLCWNRGKTLVGRTDGNLDRLLQRADVFLTDAGPTALAADGLDGPSLRERAPALASVWMPAIAPSGRWSELPHDHLLLDAISGFAAHHPAWEERPVASVVPQRHLVQGALAAGAALTGLLARERDGWGRAAIVSGLHAEAAVLCTLVSRAVVGPPVLSPGKLLPGSPNFRLYEAGDGRWLFLAALSPDLFIKALEVLDRLEIFVAPEIAGEFLNVMKPDVARSVGAQLDVTFAAKPADEWLARFAAAGVPAAPASDPATWLRGDVIAHACPPVTFEQPDVGTVVMPGTPVRLDTDVHAPGGPPAVSAIGDAGAVWRNVEAPAPPAGPPPGPDDRPLAGLKVVDLATFLAAPFVSTLLALHGADVVKVEAPAGDPYSVFTASYGILAEHKPRFTADLNDASERARLLELVAHADVVVDNLIASSLSRLQLAPEVFAAANPDLVRCSVTAYGADGPYAENPGFDPIMQTLSGLVVIQGGDGPPVASAAASHDVTTGCVGALGTLAALWVRTRRGHGQRVFTSLAASSTYLQSAELTTYAGRPPRPVGGVDFPGPSAWQRYYHAADRWIAISARSDAHRDGVLDVLGRADLAESAGMDDASRAAAIATAIEARPADEWVQLLAAAGVPACAAVNRVELDDPFLVEHHYSHVIETDVGPLEIVSGFTDWQHTGRRPPLPREVLRTDRDEVLARWSS